MKKLIFFAIISIAGFMSCKKSNVENCAVSMTGIAGTYKLTALKYQQTSGSPETDWYTTVVQACKRDDLYVLASDGTFTLQDAGTVCSPDGNDSGVWTLTGNDIDMAGYYSGSIQSYDCTTLIFTNTDVLNSGDKVTATFVKQ
jgi:hypothetical protein